MSMYFCVGDCAEDVKIHLMPHPSLHSDHRTRSSVTILRAINEQIIAHVECIKS